MKLKNDFITNSSSASFILKVKTEGEMNLEEFKTLFNECIEAIKKSEIIKVRFWNGSDITGDENDSSIFYIEDWISMYNGHTDIPGYMKLLCVESLHEGSWLEKYCFKVVSLRTIDDH